MSQLNPKLMIEKGVFVPSEYSEVQQIGIDVTMKLEKETRLFPGHYINLEINESVNLPENIYSDLTIRSSYSRKGVFQSSGIYDPGFHGTCGLSLYNMGEEPITLVPNERIAQMVFYEADSASVYDGHYNHTESTDSQYK